MKKTQLFDFLAVLAAFVLAGVFFVGWQFPASLLYPKSPPVDAQTIRQSAVKNFIGKPAADDIPRIETAADLWNAEKSVDYFFTAEPIGVVPTGVYGLNHWTNPYHRVRVGRNQFRNGKPKQRVVVNPLLPGNDYNQYYLLQLADGSHILAQLPREAVSAIKQGKNAVLPIGRSMVITDGSQTYLEEICKEYDANPDYMLYLFDDQWYQDNEFLLSFLRIAIAFALFLGLSLIFVIAVEKLTAPKVDPLQ